MNESVKPASEQLLTESTAQYLKKFFSDLNSVRNAPAESLQNDILTYLSEIQRLNSSNANLVHENDELMTENEKLKAALIRERDDALIWDGITVVNRINKILEELNHE